MKKLIKYTLGYTGILGVMFAASGCSDWLEPKPLSFFTPENTFNSYEGLKTSTVTSTTILRQDRPNLVSFQSISFQK